MKHLPEIIIDILVVAFIGLISAGSQHLHGRKCAQEPGHRVEAHAQP